MLWRSGDADVKSGMEGTGVNLRAPSLLALRLGDRGVKGSVEGWGHTCGTSGPILASPASPAV